MLVEAQNAVNLAWDTRGGGNVAVWASQKDGEIEHESATPVTRGNGHPYVPLCTPLPKPTGR